MFVVLLKFSDNKSKAAEFMEGHNAWLKRGFDDGVFLLAGSLQPSSGGGIMAHNTSLADLQTRVKDDPFVAENVVSAEVLEIAVDVEQTLPDEISPVDLHDLFHVARDGRGLGVIVLCFVDDLIGIVKRSPWICVAA